MTSAAIRRSFLDFFREKEHTLVPSSSLLPDSPNLLFTNAGMNQFVPIFLGQAPCPYRPARAADTQKCIRAGGKHNDLEDVGFDTYHHTFFEMLGNWSFGDYFKKEAITWAWELVVGTKRWNFPASRLYATVYCPHMDEKLWFQELKALELNIDAAEVINGDKFRTIFLNNHAEHLGITIEHSDVEAVQYWFRLFRSAGLDPYIHIVPGNKKDNFWMMGETGPCGPCSELHVDLTPGDRELDEARQRAGRELVNKGDARCIEIWNLVFIQFNARITGYRQEGEGEFRRDVPSEWEFDALPAKHVDTGMGFERVCSIMQGTHGLQDFSAKAKISNYETDVFRPIFDALEKLTGKKYASTLPGSAQNLSEQEKIDVAFRVIADHIRTLSFSIADGIRPSNEGRGYVLRRILRRAVRYGRNLGLREPFLAKLVPVLGETMGEIFPEVIGQAPGIEVTLTQEEESFFRTLERGIELFENFAQLKPTILAGGKHYQRQQKISPDSEEREFVIPGEVAFKLFDTYGFPLDLTELMARERGWAVEVSEFNRLMDEQKSRAKAAQKKEQIKVDIGYGDSSKKTEFVGYDKSELIEPVAGVSVGHSGEDLAERSNISSVFFEKTVFFAEMGGQVGDTGEIEYGGTTYRVKNTVKSATLPIFLHVIESPKDIFSEPGTIATLRVDQLRRARIEAHHSGTHVLNWALRKVLGTTITQKGSYVGPDRLRFDFSHGAAMTPEQVAEVERLVNERITADVPVTWEERPYAEVKGDPSILQFFGDKYGEMVRVVSIGDFSRELCGGTHVRQSGRIGYFKILSEGAIAAGVRRIEAASGVALGERLHERIAKQDEQFAALKARKSDLAALPIVAADASPEILAQVAESREEALRAANAAVVAHEKEQSKAAEADFQRRASADAAELIAAAREVGGIPLIAHQVGEGSAAYLAVLADAIKARWQGVAILSALEPGKIALLCAVAPAFSKKVQAGKIIQAMAPLVGGKGGGRPELAQGGGTQPEGWPTALAKAEELVGAAG
jgi:alanyl-tRNA synthetase